MLNPNSMRSTLRRLLLAAIALLYVVSVPWYRETGAPVEYAFGLPSWAAVALACYVGVALLNCAAWLLSDVHDEETPTGPPEPADVTGREAP